MAKTAKLTRRELARVRAEVGRLGGLVTSAAKTKAARKNGKLGGRPLKGLATPEFASRMVLGLEAADRAFAEAAVWLAHHVAAS